MPENGYRTRIDPGLSFAFQKRTLANIFLPEFCFVWRKKGKYVLFQKPEPEFACFSK